MTTDLLPSRDTLTGPLPTLRQWHGRLAGSLAGSFALFLAAILGPADNAFLRVAIGFSALQSVTMFIVTRGAAIDLNVLTFRRNASAALANAALWLVAILQSSQPALIEWVFGTALHSRALVAALLGWMAVAIDARSLGAMRGDDCGRLGVRIDSGHVARKSGQRIGYNLLWWVGIGSVSMASRGTEQGYRARPSGEDPVNLVTCEAPEVLRFERQMTLLVLGAAVTSLALAFLFDSPRLTPWVAMASALTPSIVASVAIRLRRVGGALSFPTGAVSGAFVFSLGCGLMWAWSLGFGGDFGLNAGWPALIALPVATRMSMLACNAVQLSRSDDIVALAGLRATWSVPASQTKWLLNGKKKSLVVEWSRKPFDLGYAPALQAATALQLTGAAGSDAKSASEDNGTTR